MGARTKGSIITANGEQRRAGGGALIVVAGRGVRDGCGRGETTTC
ncbi:hypothetical protein E2C01_061734 [Portunus trituberculatus]|uniref:Uncharacterized protein n=1 Tax=Portunus trituberculatus TaxID=210409 RepID=A0A5B7HE32_PORTR|nr:hypothetical protein [Portunus trituberculatus]